MLARYDVRSCKPGLELLRFKELANRIKVTDHWSALVCRSWPFPRDLAKRTEHSCQIPPPADILAPSRIAA